MKKMTDINLRSKRVLIREDFNVPLQQGVISSDTRIKAALPTIRNAIAAGAKVLLMSHLGRPTEGKFNAEYSLAPIAQRLAELLGQPVKLLPELATNEAIADGSVVLFENCRFNLGEKNNDSALAQKIAGLCDIFVMDAFATAHRAEASTCGVAEYALEACAGPLLVAELTALAAIMEQPAQPLVAIVGGAKVSTKLLVLESLLDKVNQLIVGGGIANTFLAAKGYPIGQSLYEADLLPAAKHLLLIAEEKNVQLFLPVDAVTAEEFSPAAVTKIKSIDSINNNEMIVDIGPQTIELFTNVIANAGTILWNGPVGAFEYLPFSSGTKALALAIAKSKAYSVAGGGDTLAAIEQYQIATEIGYISTGGGAFLEYLEGKSLPAIAVLEKRSKQ